MTQQVRLPKTTLNIVGATNATENAEQKILFVGQKTSAGSASSGALVEDISLADISSLFGADSMIAIILRAAKDINNTTKMDAISLDDNGSGVDATGTFTITGPATEDGTLTFFIGSKINGKFEIAVADTDSATVIGDALAAAITADLESPVDAANVAGVVTLTAINAGTFGNDIGMKVEGSVAGVAVAIVAMASGAIDPVLTTVFDSIDELRYQTIVWPSNYGVTELIDLLDDRFNVDNAILDGVGITSDTDTLANLKSTYTSLNEKLVIVQGNKLIDNSDYKGSAIFELDVAISSEFAAIRALRLTDGEAISDFVIAGTSGARDNFGGDAIRSLPYFNTPFDNLPVIETGLGFTKEEIDELKTAGVFVLGNNSANNNILAGEVVTLYKTDSLGSADLSFKFLNYVDTISGIREYFFNNQKTRYAQSRLTEGDIIEGRNMANENSIRAFLVRLYNDLSGTDFVLVQAGESALSFYKGNLVVEIDLENGKVTETMKVPIVTQLREIIGTIQLSFTTN